MEKQKAIRMWNRSEKKISMRYSAIISDGDASTYSALCDNVDYLVDKEECVIYFSERLDARLRNLKKEYVIETKTRTGRKMRKNVLGGKEKLTDTTIGNLGMSLALMKIKNMNTALQARIHGASTIKLSH